MQLLQQLLFAALQCPPPNVSYVPQLNLSAFIQSPWYSQEQMSVIYQKPNEMFCVVDRYTMDGPDTLFMTTTWNIDTVDGKEGSAKLHGIIEDMGNPSHWLVGFKYMPRFIRGPYWVIDTYPRGNQETYDWMIVSGGLPTKKGKDGRCKTGTFFNNSGLWLFTRMPNPPAEWVQEMRQRLEDLGYDTSILIKVDHKGCQYPFETNQ
jgi:lipocalin